MQPNVPCHRQKLDVLENQESPIQEDKGTIMHIELVPVGSLSVPTPACFFFEKLVQTFFWTIDSKSKVSNTNSIMTFQMPKLFPSIYRLGFGNVGRVSSCPRILASCSPRLSQPRLLLGRVGRVVTVKCRGVKTQMRNHEKYSLSPGIAQPWFTFEVE